MYDFTLLREEIKSNLPSKRYEHTLGVSYTACALAMAHQEDIYKAQLAGLLHDCAKAYKGEELIKLCLKHGIKLTDSAIAASQVVHAIYGAYLAEQKYNIKDEDILNAVRYHTTGRSDMSKLEKIVYIADYIEPLRNQVSNLNEIRELAFKDLDLCMYTILKQTVDYLSEHTSNIDEDTISALLFYKEKANDR
ncbi:MAG: bis(5'-nucleosyl)-tetraphosphatase (symmetrical) YqeK [Eubacteriales bacterium]|nr:bis(5'-nucleosyl)-tetraphosphatase (symmetrical) YqeK [Eubacteriales bacterium]